MAAEAGITCRPVGVEAPNAMSVGERYHAPLRKTFLKLQGTYGMKVLDEEMDEPPKGPGRPRKNPKKILRDIGPDDEYLLSIAVMSINSTVGPEGICPTLLVFGAMPKLLFQDLYLLHFHPELSFHILSYGDKNLVYHDITKRWEPRTFVSRNENTILVLEPDGDTQPYSINLVSDFKEGTYLPRPDLYGFVEEGSKENHETILPTALPDEFIQDIADIDDEDDAQPQLQLDTRTGNPASPYDQIKIGDLHDSDINEMMFFDNGEKQPETPDELEYELAETLYTMILKKNSDQIKNFTDVIKLRNMTIIRAKLILSIKYPGTPIERKKARIVSQAIGKRDRDKSMLMTYSPTVNKSSVRLILSIAGGKKLPVFLRDISLAYVSTNTKLLREVYLIPPKELGLDPDILWLALKPLYGLLRVVFTGSRHTSLTTPTS
eukprot:IDg1204t1